MQLVQRTIFTSILGVIIALTFLGLSPVLKAEFANAQSEDIPVFTDAETLESQDQRDLAKNVIQTMLGFLAVLAIMLTLLGGLQWMTAGGNDDVLQKAKKLFFSGLIGLALIVSAWAITMFVIRSLVESNL